MIKRKLENQLTLWFNSKKIKPLVLRGARQVGKSTLVRQWVKNQGLKLAEINLERHLSLSPLFVQKKLPELLKEFEAIAKVPIKGSEVILFLDEIQAIPEALPVLRYFYEDKPDLPILAAGSLLEFVLAEHEFSMPVGRVEYLHIGPLTFTEFLGAMNDDFLQKLIADFGNQSPIPLTAHQQLLQRQREFLFVGGMPEAVAAYCENQSPLEARAVHRTIVQTYQDDFAKYARANRMGLLHRILDFSPKLVGHKVKYSVISPDHRAVEVKDAIDMLIKARLILPCHHSDCSGLPLRAGRDDKIYKFYFLDVGLFNYLCGLEWSHVARLDERELVNEGKLAEQFVAQHLAYHPCGLEPPELFYWLRESRAANAEVDFVIARDRGIIPVEVKSGKSGSLKSLQRFMRDKKQSLAWRFDLNLPSHQKIRHHLTGVGIPGGERAVAFELHSWPLYLVELLQRQDL